MTPRVVLAVATFVALISSIAALRDEAAPPQPMANVVLATLPPPAAPPAPLRLPGRTVFTQPADTDQPLATLRVPADAKATSLNIGYGILGVSLAGEQSVATLFTPNGTQLLTYGSAVNGHRVVDISEAGVKLDNGVFIPRGFGEGAGADGSLEVPPISGNAPEAAPASVNGGSVMGPTVPGSPVNRPAFSQGANPRIYGQPGANPATNPMPGVSTQQPNVIQPNALQTPSSLVPTALATPQIFAPMPMATPPT